MKKLLFFLFFSCTCFGQQTTAIADTSFEKALIELQLDSILDGELLNENSMKKLSLNDEAKLDFYGARETNLIAMH